MRCKEQKTPHARLLANQSGGVMTLASDVTGLNESAT